MDEKTVSVAIKEILLQDFETQNRKGLYSVTQKMMAYHSNRIEGSTLTSEQTASLFDTGTIVSNGVEVYKAKDIEETNGHFKMFNQMLKTLSEPWSEDVIKQYHYQLKNGVFEDIANGRPVGEYKNRANAVSDITTALPQEVASEMKKLLEWYAAVDKDLSAVAQFHARFEHIHPFQDGNGRTGRMIMLRQCLEAGLIPVIIREDNKDIYRYALHKAQTEKDYENLIQVFQNSQQEYYERVKPFLK